MFSHTMKSVAERNLFRKAPVNRRAVAASVQSHDSSELDQNKEVESDALSTDISDKIKQLKDVIQDIGRDEVRVYHATSSTPKLTPRRVAKKAEVQM